jgi:hypothetical protein
VVEAGRVALRRRYAAERDKRLGPDGNDRYLELTGPFGRMPDDPCTPQGERDPRRDHVTVAFAGGDPDGAPVDRLAGKRVAIIGTGATWVQCVPHRCHRNASLAVIGGIGRSSMPVHRLLA